MFRVCASKVAKSIVGFSAASPYSVNCSASRMSRAALASTRVGTQPSLVQVPPICPRSISATDAPSSRARSAAVAPAGPPPMTIRSNMSSLLLALSPGPSQGTMPAASCCLEGAVNEKLLVDRTQTPSPASAASASSEPALAPDSALNEDAIQKPGFRFYSQILNWSSVTS